MFRILCSNLRMFCSRKLHVNDRNYEKQQTILYSDNLYVLLSVGKPGIYKWGHKLKNLKIAYQFALI